MELQFFTQEWADAARAAYNAGPSDEARAEKIDRYWEWIDDARQHVNCKLGLAVRDSLIDGPDFLLMQLEDGVCTAIESTSRERAEAEADYVLAGSEQDWRDIMSGFDMGKSIMYRKILLEKGEVLDFFKQAYYWKESLACVQNLPTHFGSGTGS